MIAIDANGLAERARACDAVFELLFRVGDFVPEGAPALATYGTSERIDDGELRRYVGSANERSTSQDPAFGLRQLVDIASRALSSGVNDPTTAVQAIDQIHDLLLRLGSGRLHSGAMRDGDGKIRLIVPTRDWDDYVHLAIEEIRLYGAGSIQVTRRLNAMLEDLEDRLPVCRSAALNAQSALLTRAVARSFEEPDDQRRALA